MDVNYDLLRSLAIIIGVFLLISFMANCYYSSIAYSGVAPGGNFTRIMTTIFGASLLIVFIADHISRSITASTAKAKAFVLAIVVGVSLLTVFIANHTSSGLPTSADGAKAFIAVLAAYILLRFGIKGLLWG
jgi:hypothetical protein